MGRSLALKRLIKIESRLFLRRPLRAAAAAATMESRFKKQVAVSRRWPESLFVIVRLLFFFSNVILNFLFFLIEISGPALIFVLLTYVVRARQRVSAYGLGPRPVQALI